MKEIFLLSCVVLFMLYWYIQDTLLLVLVVLAIPLIGVALYYMLLKKGVKYEETLENTSVSPILHEGQIDVGGVPTKVMILDNTFLNKIKSQPANQSAVFTRLPRNKIRLLSD